TPPLAVGLDELAGDPSRVGTLPPAVARALIVRAAGVLAALGTTACLGTGPPTPPDEPDRLLTAEETAQLIGVEPKWLPRKRLPFARKLSHKVVRYSEAGLTRWLATRR